jgi:hypothetical protein
MSMPSELPSIMCLVRSFASWPGFDSGFGCDSVQTGMRAKSILRLDMGLIARRFPGCGGAPLARTVFSKGPRTTAHFCRLSEHGQGEQWWTI